MPACEYKPWPESSTQETVTPPGSQTSQTFQIPKLFKGTKLANMENSILKATGDAGGTQLVPEEAPRNKHFGS